MRNERYKTITEMINNGGFIVVERHRVGDKDCVSVEIRDSMFFQLTGQEIMDGINGYIGSNKLLVSCEIDSSSERRDYVRLNITMKDTYRAKSSKP